MATSGQPTHTLGLPVIVPEDKSTWYDINTISEIVDTWAGGIQQTVAEQSEIISNLQTQLNAAQLAINNLDSEKMSKGINYSLQSTVNINPNGASIAEAAPYNDILSMEDFVTFARYEFDVKDKFVTEFQPYGEWYTIGGLYGDKQIHDSLQPSCVYSTSAMQHNMDSEFKPCEIKFERLGSYEQIIKIRIDKDYRLVNKRIKLSFIYLRTNK